MVSSSEKRMSALVTAGTGFFIESKILVSFGMTKVKMPMSRPMATTIMSAG